MKIELLTQINIYTLYSWNTFLMILCLKGLYCKMLTFLPSSTTKKPPFPHFILPPTPTPVYILLPIPIFLYIKPHRPIQFLKNLHFFINKSLLFSQINHLNSCFFNVATFLNQQTHTIWLQGLNVQKRHQYRQNICVLDLQNLVPKDSNRGLWVNKFKIRQSLLYVK